MLMRCIATALLALSTQIATANSPLVIRCHADTVLAKGEHVNVQIDISLPEVLGRRLRVANTTMDKWAPLKADSAVGLGSIEVSESLDSLPEGATENHRHQLIVSRLPDENNSLIAFYLVRSYVNTIRADLWREGKPFLYTDTYNDEVLRGKCD